MTNVAKLFNKPIRREVRAVDVDWPIPEQLVGLEIEVESMPGTKLQENLTKYWVVHNDGSLRNDPGTEYVLSSPMSGEDLNRAVYSIFEGARFQKSVTAGTHIHLDMLEENTDPELVKKLMLLIFCFEDAIFDIADKGREFCGYTNKLTSAPDYLLGAVLNGTEDNSYHEMKIVCSEDQTRLGRYYGCNILSLQKYGSVEFRYFPTATNAEELIDWIKLCQCFKLAAMNLSSLDSLYKITADEDNYALFVHTYFRNWYNVFTRIVPQGLAHQMMKKALAIASAYAANNERERFDVKSITGSKAVRSFLGIKEEDKTELDIIPTPIFIQEKTNSIPFPRPPDLPAYTIGVVYNSCAIVFNVPNNGNWISIGGSNHISTEDARIILNILRYWLANPELEAELIKKKYSHDAVVYVKRGLKDIIADIRTVFYGYVDGPMKAIPASEPMRIDKKISVRGRMPQATSPAVPSDEATSGLIERPADPGWRGRPHPAMPSGLLERWTILER